MDNDSKIASCVPLGARREQDPIGGLVFVRGQGAYLWDANGRRYLDFVSGYSSTLFGHCHPRLVHVAREQLELLTQVVGLQHPWRQALESRLAELAPMTRPAKVWLASTGARGMEVAWKLAFAHRPGSIVGFDMAYHGRSIATSLLSDTKRLPVLNGDVSTPLPFPRCDVCALGLQPSSCHAECFDDASSWIESNAKKISAIVVEPAIGARGYYYAPPVFFRRLREVTRQHDILLIDDEIQMGLGRLGGLFACQKLEWEPDLVVLGKSLGGGIVAISAVLGRSDVMDSLPPGYESETFAANPLACRLALESLDILVRDRLLDRAKVFETWFDAALQALRQKSTVPIRVTCQGASGVIEVCPNGQNLTVDKRLHSLERTSANEVVDSLAPSLSASIARHWVTQARDAGLLLHWSGIDRNRIVLIPPLIANETDFHEAFDVLTKIVQLDVPFDVPE